MLHTEVEVEMEDEQAILRSVHATDPIVIIDALYGLFKDGTDMLAELEADHAAEIAREYSLLIENEFINNSPKV